MPFADRLQASIITTGTIVPDHRHHPGRITSALDRNDIVIVAGFQGWHKTPRT